MKIEPLLLETERLKIRTYTLGDATALYRMISANREVLADYFTMSVEKNTSAMASRKYILERNADRKAGKSIVAGIFLKKDGTLIGQVIAKDINPRVPKCEMGYFIGTDYMKQGYGFEAVNAFIHYLFHTHQLVKIRLGIAPENNASRALAEKCGFTMIGTAQKDFRGASGKLMDCQLWEKMNGLMC